MDEEKDKDEDVQSADVLERNERESEKIEAERRHWYALGVVGKAHNIVMWVHGKPQHRSAWINQHIKELKKEMLQADNETRWNTTWNMLHVFQRQKERIEVYVDLVPELTDDKLTEAEWKDIDNILQLLEPFKKLTILGEERGTLYGSVNSILWGMDMLLELLEKEKKKSRPSEAPFRAVLEAAWKKLDKYYNLTDKSTVYVIATMLDPCMKYKYFERNW